MKHFVSGVAIAAALAAPAWAQDGETKVIGVSIPSATHGFMGGLNWHAQDTIKRLGETYPNLEFVLSTAGDSAKQVNDIEDMVATRNIDALVVLPFESEPLTDPVKQVKAAGKFVTVVDRGLSGRVGGRVGRRRYGRRCRRRCRRRLRVCGCVCRTASVCTSYSSIPLLYGPRLRKEAEERRLLGRLHGGGTRRTARRGAARTRLTRTRTSQ